MWVFLVLTGEGIKLVSNYIPFDASFFRCSMFTTSSYLSTPDATKMVATIMLKYSQLSDLWNFGSKYCFMLA